MQAIGSEPRTKHPPHQDWRELRARDVMHGDVVTVTSDTPLAEVGRVLVENRITGVPVTDETGRTLGVISMRDLIECYAQDPDARPRQGGGFDRLPEDDGGEVAATFALPDEAEPTAGEVMTPEAIAVDAGLPLPDVARRMVTLQVHRLLVEENGRHVGIVSTMDVLGALSERASGSPCCRR